MKKIGAAALLVAVVRIAAHAAPAPAEVATEQTEAADPDPTRHFNFTNTDWRGKDEYGGPLGDRVQVTRDGQRVEEEPMSPPFMYMLINFGILLLLLGRYGWPFAKKLAEDRHDQIKSALDDAAALREQAAQKLAEYETRVKNVDAEIQALVAGIRKDAEADKARILAAAEAQAAQMKRDAELRIAAEIEQARAQLRQDVTAATVAATEALLKKQTTAADQKKLVATFISNLGAPQ